MGWAIMFLVLIALVIILSISLINWKIQIYKVIVQLNAILNRKTKKLVTVSLSDRRLEHLVEIINQIVSKDNIYLGEIQKKENELKENILYNSVLKILLHLFLQKNIQNCWNAFM